jgi:hypothetical protein
VLIPVNPSKALRRKTHEMAEEDARDVCVDVVPAEDAEEVRVGRAKVSGRSAIFNRRGP